MRVIDPNRVYLDKGDVVPVFCSCGETYQPPANSTESRCPKCRKRNFHADQTVYPEMRH